MQSRTTHRGEQADLETSTAFAAPVLNLFITEAGDLTATLPSGVIPQPFSALLEKDSVVELRPTTCR